MENTAYVLWMADHNMSSGHMLCDIISCCISLCQSLHKLWGIGAIRICFLVKTHYKTGGISLFFSDDLRVSKECKMQPLTRNIYILKTIQEPWLPLQ